LLEISGATYVPVSESLPVTVETGTYYTVLIKAISDGLAIEDWEAPPG
jgi:hypothetical protein